MVFRWLPAFLLVMLLTLWALVAMGGLARVAAWLGLLFVAPSLGLGTALLVGAYAILKRRMSLPIGVALTLSCLVVVPGLWPLGIFAVPYPAGNDGPVLKVRVPADQPMQVYWGGDQLEQNYHALYPDQRFAYDLVIPPAGILSDRLEDYGCFDVPVLAPIDGTVSAVHDGEPDQTPGVVAETEIYAGNHVVLRVDATQTHLLLAHLKQGSVQVDVGAQVKEGQVLGRCGNSGRTSEPHVHLHHQRQPVGEGYPLGFAEGLPLFFRDQTGPERPVGGVREMDERIELSGDQIAHQSGYH